MIGVGATVVGAVVLVHPAKPTEMNAIKNRRASVLDIKPSLLAKYQRYIQYILDQIVPKYFWKLA